MSEPETPKRLRILITGSRSWDDYETFDAALNDAMPKQWQPGDEVTVVHGACGKGADAMAAYWCEENAWWVDNLGGALVVEPHPADWDAACRPSCRHGYRIRDDGKPYCPGVGPYRNQDMVNLGADICLAFLDGPSRGTTDCRRRAEKAGIPVRRYERTTRDG